MAVFSYKALSFDGKEKKGLIDGDSERQVRQLLLEKKLAPIEVKAVADKQAKGQPKNNANKRLKINLKELSLITRQFATLVKTGLPLEEALSSLIEQAHNDKQKIILSGILSHIKEGSSISHALKQYPATFPPLYYNMVEAGEESGQLAAVLLNLSEYYEKRQISRQQMTAALVYPALLTIVGFAIIGALLTYVVPQVIDVFNRSGKELPQLTQTLLAINDMIMNYGLYLFTLLLIMIMLINRLLKIPKFRFQFDKLLLKLPLVGRITMGFNTSRLASTLAILTASGVPLLRAIQTSTGVVLNSPMRHSIQTAAEQLKEGQSLAMALKQSKLFSPVLISLIANGEAGGNQDEMLKHAAIVEEQELNALLTTLTSMMEPLLIVIMGGLVFLIVLGVMLPIFEFDQLIG